jgi:hypothetical protein
VQNMTAQLKRESMNVIMRTVFSKRHPLPPSHTRTHAHTHDRTHTHPALMRVFARTQIYPHIHTPSCACTHNESGMPTSCIDTAVLVTGLTRACVRVRVPRPGPGWLCEVNESLNFISFAATAPTSHPNSNSCRHASSVCMVCCRSVAITRHVTILWVALYPA